MAYDLTRLYQTVRSHLWFNPDLQLDELSQLVRVERHTVEKAVRLATGKTFREMKKDILFRLAIQRLHDDPSLSIKEVAFKLGYCSQGSFCRFVKAMAGCSPMQLRADRPPDSTSTHLAPSIPGTKASDGREILKRVS